MFLTFSTHLCTLYVTHFHFPFLRFLYFNSIFPYCTARAQLFPHEGFFSCGTLISAPQGSDHMSIGDGHLVFHK